MLIARDAGEEVVLLVGLDVDWRWWWWEGRFVSDPVGVERGCLFEVEYWVVHCELLDGEM